MKILYQYTIKTDGQQTILVEKGDRKRSYLPIAATYQNAEECPIVAAELLRDLAKWAIEQAEIIEELNGFEAIKADGGNKYEAER